MHNSAVRVFVAAFIMLLAIAFWSYRVRAAAEEAAEFAPSEVSPVLVPAGTTISAAMRGGIPEFAAAGDKVTAFVLRPVVLNGKLLVPADAELKGGLEQVSVKGGKARVRMSFTVLLIEGRSWNIRALPVTTIAPVQSDLETIGSAFDMLLGGSLGATIGAASGDLHLVQRGMFLGAGVSAPEEPTIPVNVILTHNITALE